MWSTVCEMVYKSLLVYHDTKHSFMNEQFTVDVQSNETKTYKKCFPFIFDANATKSTDTRLFCFRFLFSLICDVVTDFHSL